MRWCRRTCAAVAAILALALAAAPALGHPVVSASAVVRIDRDGRVCVVLQHDALAFALNEAPTRIADAPMFALLSGPEEDLGAALADGQERMAAGLRLLAGGAPLPIEIAEAPTVAGVLNWKRDNPGFPLPVKMEFVAVSRLPGGASAVSIRFPEILGDVILSMERPGREPIYLPLRPGEVSPAFELTPPAGEGMASTSRPPRLRWHAVAWRYVVLGFTHIIPGGLDHGLFVLGLFLLNPRAKALLWQITAFTIAHSTTLTLTTLHLVSMPRGVVEPTIAATIAFVGVENLLTTRVHPWRPAVAFLFGLVHGMGFASALSEVGLPTGQLVAGLVSFNAGVECGHIAVLALAMLALGRWRDRPWYRRRIAIPGSLAIAAVALVWIVQRLA